jgi:tetratricopeptide (TPR) repeat protein
VNWLRSREGCKTVGVTLLWAAITCTAFAARTPDYAASAITLTADLKQDQTNQLPVLSDGQYKLKRGEAHSYRITLTASQFVNAVVEQQGIDAVVTIFNPDGSQLSVTDSINGRFGSEPVLLVATTSGNYRVEIKCASTDPEATYQIRVIAIREATAADREYVRAQRTFEEADKLRSQAAATAKRAALEKYKDSLSGFRSAGDTYRQAMNLWMLGLTHMQLNEFRPALPYLEEGISLSKTLGDRRSEAAIETVVGGAHDVLGNIGESREHYQRAITLAHGLRGISTEGSALNNIGKLYGDAGDFQKALDYYLQALPIFNDLPNQRAITLNNIGVAYSSLGEFEKALDYLRQSLTLLRTVNDRNAESYTLSNI